MAKLVLDCDPGQDDALAILLAAHHHELLAITTVHGNAPLAAVTRNALALLTLTGLDVPVAAGCPGPLLGEARHALHVHGESGLDGATLPVPDRDVLPRHAVELLIDLAKAHQGELWLAALGPLTNLALAIRLEPRLPGWLAGLLVMGGSTERGNITPAAEFNVACDPEAAAIVLGCGAPLWLTGLNVTRRVVLQAADVATLRAAPGRTAAVVADLVAFYLGRQAAMGRAGAALHDPCALLPLIEPAALTFRPAAVMVELSGSASRGMSVIDFERPGPVQVAVEANNARIVQLVLAAVVAHP